MTQRSGAKPRCARSDPFRLEVVRNVGSVRPAPHTERERHKDRGRGIEPKRSRGGRRIYFLSDREALAIINPNGTGLHTLTPDYFNHVLSFALSPNGRQIAFSAGTGHSPDIYVMNRDGTRLKKLTYNERVRDVDPMWSPDGRQIVFTTERDGNSEIYVMNADGSKQTNISRNRGDDFAAAWRPTC